MRLVEDRGAAVAAVQDMIAVTPHGGARRSRHDDSVLIGVTTRAALLRFLNEGAPYAGSTDPQAAGNGSIMRLAPVPLFFAATPEGAIERAADSSRTTHGAREAVDACRYLAALLVGAVRGASKDELLAPRYTPVPGLWDRAPLTERIDAIAAGSFRRRDPPAIRGTGYVVDSLEAALWAFDRAESFHDGALRAVNLGDDADTTGAVYGQLAGAYYRRRRHPRRVAPAACAPRPDRVLRPAALQPGRGPRDKLRMTGRNPDRHRLG